ncbi:hypothetical protein KCTC52924_01899 [Arenibacter antarcticus]|uniref:Secreted protein n=1 Tax=Arenibacter antarcticus TaxID=2040469 RepID=A0ABW5VHY9_9FLAO|nr:hypothetical protein [Arenibacter sp. H213]
MNYRIKSLVYLIGFITSVLVYSQLQEETDTEKEVLTIESNNVDDGIANTDY